jgi:hypothetical protein
VTDVKTTYFETIQRIDPGEPYKTCDGIPRIRYNRTSGEFITRTVTVVREYTTQQYTTDSKKYPYQNYPMCTPDGRFCNELFAASNQGGVMAKKFIGGKSARLARPIPYFLCPNIHQCGLEVGEEVVLLYWPPNVQSSRICDGTLSGVTLPPPAGLNNIFTTNAITFKGRDLYSVGVRSGKFSSFTRPTHIHPSVLTGNFTFIRPTVYLAHHAITAQSRWTYLDYRQYNLSGIQTYVSISNKIQASAGIIPLNPEDIFSIRERHGNPKRGLEYAQLVSRGQFNPKLITHATYGYGPDVHETLPFEFAALGDPVPASVYYDARSDDCWGKQSHCGTIVDGSYRPRLWVNNSVWESFVPDDARDCGFPLLYDPPIALSPISGTLTVPSAPVANPTPEFHPAIDSLSRGDSEGIMHPFNYNPSTSRKPSPGQMASPPYPSPTGTDSDHSGWRTRPGPKHEGTRGDSDGTSVGIPGSGLGPGFSKNNRQGSGDYLGDWMLAGSPQGEFGEGEGELGGVFDRRKGGTVSDVDLSDGSSGWRGQNEDSHTKINPVIFKGYAPARRLVWWYNCLPILGLLVPRIFLYNSYG